MKLKSIYFVLFAASYLLLQCMPPSPDPILTTINRDLKDPLLQKISYEQDHQITDSLLTYFHHKDPTYRYAAAMAFGSVQDKTVLDSLAILLKDTLEEVRMAAAYAIGQQGDLRGEQFLIGAFEQYDSLGQYKRSNGAILEAVGRCASKDFLTSLSSISTYSHKDTFLLEGQARGIYRYSLRKIIDPTGTSKMLEFVNNPKYPSSVRLMGANYLGRTKNIDITDNVEALSQTFEQDKDPRIRMALALALNKIQQPRAIQSLLKQLSIEKDYRVKCNIIRALKSFEYDAVKTDIWAALDDSNAHVAQTAAQFFVDNGVPQEAKLYRLKAKEEYSWPIQISLLEAASRHLPLYMTNTKGAINAELKRRYEKSINPFERAQTLKALAEFGWNYQYLQRQLPLLQSPIEKTALIEALEKITTHLDFYKTFGGNFRRVSQQLGIQFIDALKSGDVGMMAVAARALRHENIDFKTILLDSLPTIVNAQQSLELPQSIEIYNELQKTIDLFNGKKTTVPKIVAHNHPIDTSLFAKISSNPSASIKTNKGTIQLRLDASLAPGSVLNFIQLAESGYYQGKYFHRVVPNFVIQGGCARGDGYGGLDYTIRSEVPIAYYDTEGYVGMASAGKHTEGTQFFITHSPTPHLDGNYTIFAKVIKGMEVVHQIEAGDVMEEVKINY